MHIGTTKDVPDWPLFIGFYTPEYKEEAEGLIESLEKFNLPFEVQARMSAGSWWMNTQLKAEVILDALQGNPKRPLVYVDCDARVRQSPTLFRTLGQRCNFSAHYKPDHRLNLFPNGKELLSGTLFFDGSKICHTLVKQWIKENQARAAAPRTDWTQLMDQRTLQAVLEGPIGDKLTFLDLPPTYVQIFDTMRAAGDPVIEHMQASRRLRRTIR
jgi:hypothetical protein